MTPYQPNIHNFPDGGVMTLRAEVQTVPGRLALYEAARGELALTLDDLPIALSKLERRIVAALMLAHPVPLTHARLAQIVYGYSDSSSVICIRTFVSYLRGRRKYGEKGLPLLRQVKDPRHSKGLVELSTPPEKGNDAVPDMITVNFDPLWRRMLLRADQIVSIIPNPSIAHIQPGTVLLQGRDFPSILVKADKAMSWTLVPPEEDETYIRDCDIVPGPGFFEVEYIPMSMVHQLALVACHAQCGQDVCNWFLPELKAEIERLSGKPAPTQQTEDAVSDWLRGQFGEKDAK